MMPTNGHRDALLLLAQERSALVPVKRLPVIWAVGRLVADSVLGELLSARLVAIWKRAPGGVAVVLTDAAAAELGLELHSPDDWHKGRDQPELSRTRWVPKGKRRSERAQTKGASTNVDLDKLPQPSPRSDRFALWPVVILGVQCQWPEALDAEVCPGCDGRKLRRYEACIVCIERAGPHRAHLPSLDAVAVWRQRGTIELPTRGQRRPRSAEPPDVAPCWNAADPPPAVMLAGVVVGDGV